MAGAEGFEPPTVGFGDRCSTNWNYAPTFALIQYWAGYAQVHLVFLHIQQLHYPCDVVGRFGNRQRHKEGTRIILMKRKVTSKIYTLFDF